MLRSCFFIYRLLFISSPWKLISSMLLRILFLAMQAISIWGLVHIAGGKDLSIEVFDFQLFISQFELYGAVLLLGSLGALSQIASKYLELLCIKEMDSYLDRNLGGGINQSEHRAIAKFTVGALALIIPVLLISIVTIVMSTVSVYLLACWMLLLLFIVLIISIVSIRVSTKLSGYMDTSREKVSYVGSINQQKFYSILMLPSLLAGLFTTTLIIFSLLLFWVFMQLNIPIRGVAGFMAILAALGLIHLRTVVPIMMRHGSYGSIVGQLSERLKLNV